MDTQVVKEYVLYRGAGESRQALFSDPELEVVKAHRIDELRGALRAGYARPEYTVTCRTITSVVDKDGKVQVAGATCDETEV
jgi:hypothetical protein